MPGFDLTVETVPSEPSETVELYRQRSFAPLAIVLLALAQILQASSGPASLVLVIVLSVTASAAGLVGVVKRSQAEPEEDSEADG